MTETVTIALRAAAPGTLPPPSPSTVAGVELPLGGLVTADHDFADDPAAPTVRAWMSAATIDDPTELWWRLAAAFAETGLWPLVAQELDDPDQPGRPWSTGELGDPTEQARDAESFFTETLPARGENDAEDEDWRYASGFPGLAAAQRALGDRARLPRLRLPPGRVILVPTTRPADVLGRLGWLGAINHHPASDLTAVLRSWEERFGSVPATVGFDTLGVVNEAVPADGDALFRLVAEHYAFCPDNVDQGTDDLNDYAEVIAGAPSWLFWWD